MADFKEMSRTGIMYSLDQHMKLELEVNFGSMYFVIPYGGLYTGYELFNFIFFVIDKIQNNIVKNRSWETPFDINI